MKHGVTNKFTTGNFGRQSFDIPKGTHVVYGASDCDGDPFNEWTLPAKVAGDLSGNKHDAACRFVVVHPDNVVPGGIAVQVETFGPLHVRHDRNEYEALRETLKDHKRFRVWDLDNKGEIEPGVYIVQTEHLFNNQSTTFEGVRIFDFADYSAHPDASRVRYGHYIVDVSELDAARELRAKCGYCGHSEDGAAGQWCPKCRGSEYLKPKDYKLLQMLPVSSDQPRDIEPPMEVLDDIKQHQTTGASVRAEKAIATKIAKLEQDIINAEYEADFIRDCVARGLHTHVLENMIYYSHMNKLCFGWRNPLAQSDVDLIRAALDDVWHLYDVEFKKEGK